jgi:hypothetical protein
MPKTPKNPFIPPTDHEELVVWLDARRERASKRMPELRFKQNLAMVLGHQWLAWDSHRKQWAKPSVEADDVNAPIRLTINKLASIVERAVSKLTKENPLPECRPASDDDEDVGSAKVGTRILTHELSRLGWTTYMTSFWFWPVTLGWSYTHVTWNASDGPTVLDSDVEGEEPLREGDIVIEEVPAYELVVDPSAVRFEDARWCVRTVCTTREDVFEKWGKDMIEGAEHGRSLMDEVNELSDINGGGHKSSEDFVKVHQYWQLPSRAMPKGLVITWSGKTILEGPMDYPFEHFVPAELLPGMHDAQGRTWLDDLIPMQVDYNDARSREAELRRTLVPKVFFPVGSIDPNKVNTRLQMIPFAPVNGKPEIEVPDAKWITQFEQGMARADAEMGERSGQSDATQGQTAASTPAAAILALQEADDTKLAISAKMLAKHVQDVGWHMLMLVKQFWTEDRMVRTWSEDGNLEADRFAGADVANVLDVHVESASALPRSRAARTNLALQLAPLGVFPDPRFLFRILDIPGTEFMMEHMDVDARQAVRENTQLRNGVMAKVHSFDNHAVHITEHNNFRKTQEYEALDDELRAVFDAHCAVHEELVLAASAVPTGSTPQVDSANLPPIAGREDLMMQMAPEGSPPAGGTPMYVNPATGTVNDPLAVAAGQAPSPLNDAPSNIRQAAGIGGPGEPGAVPGVSSDTQAASMGR